MAIIEKGKKGFQSKPTELKKVKRCVYYLTNKERVLLEVLSHLSILLLFFMKNGIR